MKLSPLDAAELITRAKRMRDDAEFILDMLLPDDAEERECGHPAECVQDISSMGDERYRCDRCGAEQSTPFLSIPSDPSE